MSDTTGNWCLIESDPGVFTQLIKEFGKFNEIKKKKIEVMTPVFCFFLRMRWLTSRGIMVFG